MSMSISYVSTGRTKQKQRTKDAISAAARDLFREGIIPTVEQAAESAGVSRATAYRYFANQRDLLLGIYAWTEAPSLVPEGTPDTAAARVEAVVEAITSIVAEDEAAYRAMLRLSLEGARGEREELSLRQGRRIRWIEDALEPLKSSLSRQNFRRLVLALASTIGIEVLVWLRDIAGLGTDEALRVMRWSAAAIVGSALEADRA